MIGENSIGYINTLIDIWNNGDCAVLLDWRIPFATAEEMMIEADVHVCFIEKEIFDKLQTTIPDNIRFVTYEKQNVSTELLPNRIYDKFQENYSGNEAVVIYSSGTTGKSKGIILSHYAINTNADAIIDYMMPQETDCMYITRSLTHSSTLTGELLVALKTNMQLLIGPIIVPPRCTLTNIEKFGVTIIGTNPLLLSMYCTEINSKKYKFSSLKKIYVSGSILDDRTYHLAHRTFAEQNIFNVYGLSELGPRVTAQRENKSNSVGTAINGVEILIINEFGQIAMQGERGIIHVKSESLFLGYVSGNQKLESMYNDWFNTGDVGYMDSEKELHIVGRADDMILINSHKIYPSDIEQKIQSVLNFKECVVTKVVINNIDYLCCLYVTDLYETIEIQQSLRSILIPHEIPTFFLKIDSIPKNKNGKVLVNAVKKHIINKIEKRQTHES